MDRHTDRQTDVVFLSSDAGRQAAHAMMTMIGSDFSQTHFYVRDVKDDGYPFFFFFELRIFLLELIRGSPV